MMRDFKIRKNRRAFTLVELLVVIAIIGLLSTVAAVALSGSRAKARDAKRVADMRQLVTALDLYQDQNGCLPITVGSTCAGNGGYSEANAGGWDYSSQGGFMTFLEAAGIMGDVPTDPINNMTGDGTPAGSYGYFYYCYYNGPSLGYYPEANYARTTVLAHDSGYVCK